MFMFKAGGEIIVRISTDIFECIWEREEIPSDWNKGLIVKFRIKETLVCTRTRDQSLCYLTLARFSVWLFLKIFRQPFTH